MPRVTFLTYRFFKFDSLPLLGVLHIQSSINYVMKFLGDLQHIC